MQGDPDIVRRVSELDEATAERLLQAALERLVDDGIELAVENEEDARELVAAILTQHASQAESVVRADDVVPPTAPVEKYVRSVLLMLAQDPQTAARVASSLNTLPEETQMVVEPVTAALVLGALVAFLQTKFDVHIRRKDGKTDFSFSLSKKPASDETVGDVLDVVRRVSIG
jgi:hypothetical protein